MEGLPSDTVYGYFEGTADKFHNKIALIYLGKKYSYTELKELIERFAASLQELGVYISPTFPNGLSPGSGYCD
jgi:non-ribosomal peptide synthetase component E (peptide arylation enzyme)